MCWNIVIYDGDRVVNEIETTEQAIRYFGPEAVRFNDGSPLDRKVQHDYCLCPVDIDFLCKTKKLKQLIPPDKRYDPLNHAVEPEE